jgi:hypothetical protein
MVGSTSRWVVEFSYDHPVQEHSIGDARGIYVNSNIAYSYFRDVKFFYPELLTEDSRVILLMRTKCPMDFYGRVYRLYKHKRNNRIVFFIPLPKHLRSAIAMGKKRVMYQVDLLLDEAGNKVVKINVFGGN